jgi:uncharacterized protein (DUF58 family)
VEHPDWQESDVEPSGVDPLAQAMSALRRVARPGSLVVVISDFIGFSRAAQAYLSSVARHNEVLAVFLNDPIERELPPPGRYRLVSPEGELAIDTYAAPARHDYEQAFEDRLQGLEKFCQRYGVHLMPMSTDDDPVSALQTALGRRTH